MDYANKDNTLVIEIEKRDDSFGHAFGLQKVVNYEITRIDAYIPALKDWLDVTHMSVFDERANQLLQEFIENE